MSRNKNIQYGIDNETGLIVSRCGNEVAIPVLDFEHMKPGNNFETQFNLEAENIYNALPYMSIKWTKRIPVEEKNKHRLFFGMKPLK